MGWAFWFVAGVATGVAFESVILLYLNKAKKKASNVVNALKQD